MFKLSQILLNPKKAERHPIEIVIVAFFYTSISLLLSLWIFPSYASLFMVFLIVVSSLYIVQGILIVEEKEESNYTPEKKILKEHGKTLWFFSLMFAGFLLAFIFWAIVLPEGILLEVFKAQEEAFRDIRTITGNAVYPGTFSTILLNNLRVLFLSLLLALFYGAGAIFILAWNASVMGFVIGSLARNTFGLSSLPYIFFKYFIHGIPEMLAYFGAALAGGILFISLIRADIRKGRIKRTLTDFLIIILLSVILLTVAAAIETFVSPLI